MTAADIAAVLAVLSLPVPVAILFRRRQAIRRALLIERNRRGWARDTYRDARRQYRHACARYRRARREAVRNYYRAARASRRDRRAIRRARRYERAVTLLTHPTNRDK